MKKIHIFIGSVFLSLLLKPAYADSGYDLSIFGTFAVGVSDSNAINNKEALTNKDYDEDFREDIDSKFAGQARFYRNEWSFTTQVVIEGIDGYDPDLEWAYGTYAPNDKFSVRFGRMRRTIYNYSDSAKVGYSYPWVKPPVSVYSGVTSLLESMEGISALHDIHINEWTFGTEIYYDNGNYEDKLVAVGDLTFTSNFELKNNKGIVFTLSNDTTTYRAGYHISGSAKGDLPQEVATLVSSLNTAGYNSIGDRFVFDETNLDYYHFSMHYNDSLWLFNAEYTIMPKNDDIITGRELWYIMGGRRFGQWTAHLTYSEKKLEAFKNYSDPIRTDITALQAGLPGTAATIAQLTALANNTDAAGNAFSSDINRIAFGVRYDFSEPISIKAEIQRSDDNKNNLTNHSFIVSIDFIVF